MVSCKICEEEFADESFIGRHLRKHGISVAAYYESYFPKRDLLTGEKIVFKDFEHYSRTEFVSYQNLQSWMSKRSKEEVEGTVSRLLSTYAKQKRISSAPSLVELRSANLPTPNDLYKVGLDYYQIIRKLGLQTKRKLPTEIGPKKRPDRIQIDTREKKPLEFDCEIIREKLDFGDYAESKSSSLFIERKSLPDFINTLSGNYVRFQKELLRARAAGANIIIAVEEYLEWAINFQQIDWITRFTSARPEFIFHRVREILHQFENVQFFFVRRHVLPDYVSLFIGNPNLFEEYDLQLLHYLSWI